MKKLFALLMAIVMLLSVAACGDAASIGIIGGADGPTEIFVYYCARVAASSATNAKLKALCAELMKFCDSADNFF